MKGIDGTRNGWITAEFTGDTWKLDFYEKLSSIDFDEALIDIPIGLPEDSTRKCDAEARDFLAPEKHYSIFNCPVRDAVYADSYEEACEINEEKTGKRISKQAWNIVPKIREADKEARKRKLSESHPEVFFKSLDKDSIIESKSSEKGLKDRKEILKRFGDISVIEDFEAKDVSEDDLIDAMVLSLGSKYKLESIPEDPDKDSEGLEMSIRRPKT
jgi:predicted RNase H-like nuclease